MKIALRTITKKGLGTLVVKNNLNNTTGIITDGDVKRISNMNKDFKTLKIKNVMKKKPLSVDKNMLAVEALSIMISLYIFFVLVLLIISSLFHPQ